MKYSIQAVSLALGLAVAAPAIDTAPKPGIFVEVSNAQSTVIVPETTTWVTDFIVSTVYVTVTPGQPTPTSSAEPIVFVTASVIPGKVPETKPTEKPTAPPPSPAPAPTTTAVAAPPPPPPSPSAPPPAPVTTEAPAPSLPSPTPATPASTTPVAAPSPSPVSGLTTDQQNALDAHNAARKAADPSMADLVWDPVLAAAAQAYAEVLALKSGGTLVHSTGSGDGENLYWQSGGGAPSLAGADAWINERSAYTLGDAIALPQGEAYLHYTQVVWSSTASLGMGVATAPDGSVYVVGRYFPAGNYVGQNPY